VKVLKPMRYVFAITLVLACVLILFTVKQQLPDADQARMDDVTVTVATGDWTKAVAPEIGMPAMATDNAAMRLYDHVTAEFRHEDYEAAEAGFRFFLTLHPSSPLSANAKYWLGECQFRLGRYKDAIASFDDALSEYPLHPKLTASVLMKKGLSFAKLGEIGRSRHLLELVVVQFPDTKEAALARKSLRQPSN
jgi:tol-pal system protein YbgF